MTAPSPASAARFASRAVWGADDWSRSHLRPYAGRTVHLAMWPLAGIALRVTQDGDWEDVALESPALADVRLRLSPTLLPAWAANPDKPGAALDGDGDPAFLQALRDVGDVVPLALGERLSSLVGPLAAQALTSALHALARWPAIATGRLSAGTAAYLTEETATLLKRSTFEKFAADLQSLRERVDRLGESHPASKTDGSATG